MYAEKRHRIKAHKKKRFLTSYRSGKEQTDDNFYKNDDTFESKFVLESRCLNVIVTILMLS